MNQFNNLFSPHNLRNIPRIGFGLLILSSFGLIMLGGQQIVGSGTLGVKTENSGQSLPVVDQINVEAEIKRTLAILEQRPDYAAAWQRLSVLYQEIGDKVNSDQTMEVAKKLNPDL